MARRKKIVAADEEMVGTGLKNRVYRLKVCPPKIMSCMYVCMYEMRRVCVLKT